VQIEKQHFFLRRCFVFWLFGQNTNMAHSTNPEHVGPAGARLSNILDYQTGPVLT